jgi:predicted small secreted protein
MKMKLNYIIVALLLISVFVSSCSGSRGLYGKGHQNCGCPSHRGMVG